MELVCPNCETKYKTHGTFAKHIKICNWSKIDIEKIRQLYNECCLTIHDIAKRYSKQAVACALRGHRRILRSIRLKTIKSKNKDVYKWSIESKQRWSLRRKQLYAENRLKLQFKPGQSYAEKRFFDFLTQSGYRHNEDFFTEVPFSLFRVDFFFPKLSLAVEVDGKQHTCQRRQEIDKRKDKLLASKNIDVLRISWQALHYESKEKFQEIKVIIDSHKNREFLVSKYTDKQLQCLNKLSEIENRKREKTLNIEKRKYELYQKRLADFKTINLDRGSITKLAKLWNISKTQTARFIRNKFMPKNYSESTVASGASGASVCSTESSKNKPSSSDSGLRSSSSLP